MWKGNDEVFKGYATGNGKRPTMKVKGDLLSWDEVVNNESFGGILNDDYVDISFDSAELSDKFWDMAEANDWNCLILENTTNGHIHSYWKDTQGKIIKGGVDKKLSVGLVADIHKGSTYIPLSVNGDKRFPPSFEPNVIDEVPNELLPVKTEINLNDLGEGDGRNDELFKYILVLQNQLMLNKDEIKSVLHNINDFVFKQPLSDEELEVITRDEAFDVPQFYNGKTFLHNAFAWYLKSEYHVIRIDGQLHVYDNGIYKSGYDMLQSKMIELIPTLRSTSRVEVLKYLEIITPEETEKAAANLIAFRNGIYNIVTDELLDFDPKYVLTNLIPWDYNPNAYSEIADKTLNNISCHDKDIRSLLEECIGYTFYRRNELSKAFFLTGTGANGKSTFLTMVKDLLGNANHSSLDLNELSERFSVVAMVGKLANVGDDISDEFLQGDTISLFKKIVSGNDIKAENKGQDAFFFKPTVKLLFSANEIPRMRNRGFEAIKRRMVIIPFNATFTKDSPDYDAYLSYKLKDPQVMEYLIQLGIKGLHRVLTNQGFTDSEEVREQIELFEKDNNPLLLFLDEVGEEEILYHTTKESFMRYDTFCYEGGYTKVAQQTFTKEVCKHFDYVVKRVRIEGKLTSIFEKKGDNKDE